MALHPGGLSGGLFSALGKELEDLGWQGDGFSPLKDVLELLLQFLGGWFTQDCHMPELPQEEAVG